MTVTKTLTLAAAAVLALTGCAASASDSDPDPAAPPAADASILAAYDLVGLDGREIVDRLDRTPVAQREAELMASVRPGELLLSQAGSADDPTVVGLPEELFYLSVAPYLDQTHDCYFHSLTTCRGELAGEEVQVTITDRRSGEVLVDEVTQTYDNGFVGFWLPSDIEATIRIDYQGYVATQDIATGPEDPTCLTTVQLA